MTRHSVTAGGGRREVARSYLYVPGDRPDRFAKAAGSGADAVILDLEDGVAPAGKDEARSSVGAHNATPDVQWWVRVDPSGDLPGDLAAAVACGADGVVVPGAERALLDHVDSVLAGLEGTRTPLAVIGLVETPGALLDLAALAAAPRLLRLGMGEADLAAVLGISPDADRTQLAPLRLQVVVASAAAGLLAPVGPVDTRVDDPDGVAKSTRDLVALGFTARTLIHPRQVPVVHAALAPTDRQVDDARAVVRAFEAASQQGSGVVVGSDGRLIDLAVVRSARAVLARAEDD